MHLFIGFLNLFQGVIAINQKCVVERIRQNVQVCVRVCACVHACLCLYLCVLACMAFMRHRVNIYVWRGVGAFMMPC